jgi:hypothetical protein
VNDPLRPIAGVTLLAFAIVAFVISQVRPEPVFENLSEHELERRWAAYEARFPFVIDGSWHGRCRGPRDNGRAGPDYPITLELHRNAMGNWDARATIGYTDVHTVELVGTVGFHNGWLYGDLRVPGDPYAEQFTRFELAPDRWGELTGQVTGHSLEHNNMWKLCRFD